MKNKIFDIVKKLLPYGVLFILLFLFMLLSSKSPFGDGVAQIDANGFEYMGKLLANGGIPYVDAFDHKGLLLYFINAIPYWIGGSSSIWIIELVFNYAMLILTYKTGCLFTKKRWISVIASITCLYGIGVFFQQGNYTEEYALLFIVLSLYLYLRKDRNGQLLGKLDAFLIGLSCAAVLWLRPNMITIWIVLVVMIIIDGIKNKNYSYIFRSALFFIIGNIVFSIPFILYLYLNDALTEAYFAYIKLILCTLEMKTVNH